MVNRKTFLAGAFSPLFRLYQLIEIAVERIVNFQKRFVMVSQFQESIFHFLRGNPSLLIHDLAVVAVNFYTDAIKHLVRFLCGNTPACFSSRFHILQNRITSELAAEL